MMEFNLDEYLVVIESKIKLILNKKNKTNLTYDILDTQIYNKYKLIILKEKQLKMKIGEIWQEIIGNYEGFQNLKNGNETELDIINKSKKIIIELKNRTNTDNASSKQYNLSKLARYKKNNPDYICIYATINNSTKENTLNTPDKIIIYDGYEIIHKTGYIFLKYIFGNNTDIIITNIKNIINKYLIN